MINELNCDLGHNVFVSKGKMYSVQTKNAQNINKYYAQLARNDIYFQILNELLTMQNNHSLDSLANKLFVSRSKIYNAIIELNKNFSTLGFCIDIANNLQVKADLFAFTNLIFELSLKGDNNLPSDFNLENKIREIYSYFGIRQDELNRHIYSTWIKAFFISKRCRHSKRFEIYVSNASHLNLSPLSQHKKFYRLVDELATHFSSKIIEEIDYFIVYSGLFFSSLYIEEKNSNKLFYELHEQIFEKSKLFQSSNKLEKELLNYFGIDETLRKDIRYNKNALRVILKEYNIYKIRYVEFLSTENICKCPNDVMEDIKRLPTFSSFCLNGNYSLQDQKRIVDLIWIALKDSFILFDAKLNSGLSFKSTSGCSKEYDLKKDIIEILCGINL
ncbi:helix-turn-helix domain-containing protein [Enterococcus avium]|uniref:helix-turn-helix domain-containing protein n=1 Tax=Enterococcus avium TaxID=33945 RepID=UPI0035185EBA